MNPFLVFLIGFGVGYLVCLVVAHIIYSAAMRRIQEGGSEE